MASEPTIAGEQGLYDIYGQWHVPFWQTRLFYGGVALLCLIVLCIIARRVLTHFKKNKPVLSPWDEALQSLESLKQDNIATVAQGKHFYGILTSVLKKYIHKRYGFEEYDTGSVSDESLAKTDYEFIQYLQKKSFPQDLTEQLQRIFMGSMVIKFANVEAIQEQIEKDLALAISFINQTRLS